MDRHRPVIYVLAGTNGSGKSSIGGAALAEAGYFNPDQYTRILLQRDPSLGLAEANARAWQAGVDRLEQAVAQGLDYYFESTWVAEPSRDCFRKPSSAESRYGFGMWASPAPS